MSPIDFMCSKAWNQNPQRHRADDEVLINPLRTTSIFHFTKSTEGLYGILENGLIPNYCSETLYHDDEIDITLGIPMVSFCDIPLSRTYKHTEEYGAYGIGLATEYAEDHNINPVLYVNSDSIIRNCFPSVFNGKSKKSKSVLPASMQGLLKRTYGEYQGKEIKNYLENEWRYFVKSTKELPWFRSMEEYIAWRGDGPKPCALYNHHLVSERLKFTACHINHIIVNKESEVPAMIDFITKRIRIGGSSETLSDRDKTYLTNHVTSFERIRRDY